MKKWTILCVSALMFAGYAHKNRETTTTTTTYSGGTGTSSEQTYGTGSSSSQTSTNASSQLSTTDQQFIKEAAQGGMAEVQMGRLAAKNAESDAVKQLGQKLVQDHSKANQELKKIASQKGVTLTADIGSENKSTLDHLKTLKGKEFDQAFIQHAVEDHQKDIQKFQQAAQQLQDSDLKSFAQKTLPTLQEHLQMAKSAQSSASTGSSSSSDTGTSSGTSSQKSSSDSSTKSTQQQ